MNLTKDNKPHIGIFGRRNSGKSSVINFLVGQDIAITSNLAATTTDPVKKSVEILSVGPVVLIDTAGIDDIGELGKKRIEKTNEALKIVDLALLVVSENQLGKPESNLIEQFNKNDIPFIIVFNKTDLANVSDCLTIDLNSRHIPFVKISALKQKGLETLAESIKQNLPETVYTQTSLLEGIIKGNNVVLLITPIDTEAPAGRMILPQVQTIRDVLDNNAVAITLKENAVEHFLRTTGIKPALAITDSQIFAKANMLIPTDTPLTSFSILLSKAKGPFDYYIRSTPKISELNNEDRILILESCTHHNSCEDIGRVKIPHWLKDFTKKDLRFDVVAGLSSIARPITDYALIIQCGGCMVTKRQLNNRLKPAIAANIPVTNYGMAIAYMKGIFERATAPFK